jgi:hypothetical protein
VPFTGEVTAAGEKLAEADRRRPPSKRDAAENFPGTTFMEGLDSLVFRWKGCRRVHF